MSIHRRHKYLHIFHLLGDVYPHTFFLRILLLILIHVPSNSLSILPNSWPPPMNWNIIRLLSIYLLRKITSQVHCSKFYPLKVYPSPLFSMDVPERGCSTTAVHFWAVSAYCAASSVNRTQIFFLCQLHVSLLLPKSVR